MKSILRWIAVLPGAVLGGFIITLLAKYITEFWQDDWGLAWLHTTYFYMTYALMSMVMPISYTIIGMRIAPSFKRETGIFLIAAMIVYTVIFILLTIYLNNGNYKYVLNAKSIVYFVFQFLGCLISFTFIPLNDESFNENWINNN